MKIVWLLAGAALFGCGAPSHPTTTSSPRKSPVPLAKAPSAPPTPRFDYPIAKRTAEKDVLHGVTVADPYRWLETDDQESQRLGSSHVHEPFELIEVVETGFAPRRFQQLD